MRSVTGTAFLLLVGGMLALGLLSLAWDQVTNSTEAIVPGTMQNCPQAGKWAISVWDGDNGTAPEQAFATCSGGGIAVAYYVDPQTQAWSRWFAGRSDISNLSSLSDKQGLLTLGAATGPTPTATGPIVFRGLVVGAPAQECGWIEQGGGCWWRVVVKVEQVIKMEQLDAFMYEYVAGELVTVVLPERDDPAPDVSVGDDVEVSGQESMWSCGVTCDAWGLIVWPDLFENNYIQRL
jgi:hypothetical protein